jgi:hypothetical protein
VSKQPLAAENTMKKCNNQDHPYCTQWVKPGESVCASQHTQSTISALSREEVLLAASNRPRAFVIADDTHSTSASQANGKLDAKLPHLHLSGFDPRAAGGRQTIKIELLGITAEVGAQMEMALHSELIANGGSRHIFVRTTNGHWRPVVVEFSSKNKEHGQYRMEVEVSHTSSQVRRRWVCTPVILVPRPDTSLTEIHQIFLGSHKNVKVTVDDASIAKVSSYAANSFAENLDICAKNASLADIDLSGPKGRIDVGFSTIAWDEDLIEIDLHNAADSHPYLARNACLTQSQGQGQSQGQSQAGPAVMRMRLFALSHCVLGRFQQIDPEADILLSHYGPTGPDTDGVTRRISARHAIIRHANGGFEIEDISRYGILLDGKWPGKDKPTMLRSGMQIALSASIKNIVVLEVAALFGHAMVLTRKDAGAKTECFYLIAPEQPPEPPSTPPHDKLVKQVLQLPQLPYLFHRHGGFWHLDPHSGKETALTPASNLPALCDFPAGSQFYPESYPDCRLVGYGVWRDQFLPDANNAIQTM